MQGLSPITRIGLATLTSRSPIIADRRAEYGTRQDSLFEIIAEMNARIKALNAETQRLKDVVMLGNAEEALSMIQDFGEKEF